MMKHFILILLLFSFFAPETARAQNINEQFKQEAIIHMKSGRFGEAIDLLNKYIAANPRLPEGLKLRGLCYENRGQYGEAALDLRRAIRLAPGNKEIQTILARVEQKWYAALNKKIEGHKREIAINPSKGSNYRDIGKCMREMGKWIDAEWWYDEFIKRQEPTADEVINYSEILAYNDHIAKGEKILKIYVEKYPRDQRLWSRYGFFTMWLGKNRIAIQAFETALEIKPFFKEAQDGLDQAKGKPYLFEWTDTTSKGKRGIPAPPKPQEYAVDKYYRIVKNNPNDDDARFQLVQELMKVERMEEAYQQVQMLAGKHSGEEKFQVLFDSVVSHKSRVYSQKINELTEKLDKEPNNRDNVLKLAGYYGNLNDFEKAAALLENYIQANPNDGKLNDVRFLLSKMYAWNREFEKALDPLKLALDASPDNLDYQLLRAQIGVWTDQDFDLAEKYSKNVLAKYPEKLEPLIVLGSVFIKLEQMDSAKVYLDRAVALDPEHHNVKELQTYYDFRLLAIEEAKIFAILVEGRNLTLSGDYTNALAKYDEYFSKTPNPSRLVMSEYADVNFAAGNFGKAISIYDGLLSQEDDFDVAVAKAKVHLASGDSLGAYNQLAKLREIQPDNFDVKLLQADASQKLKNYSEAQDILDELQETTTDSLKLAMVKLRYKWLPVTGLKGMILAFPQYIGISPEYSYYWDNMGLKMGTSTARADFGVTSFLSVGGAFAKGVIEGNYQMLSLYQNYNTFKGIVTLKPAEGISFHAAFGNITYEGYHNRPIMDAGVKVEKAKTYVFQGIYENMDAAVMLNSPFLLNLMIKDDDTYHTTVQRALLSAYYVSSFGLKFVSTFKYMKVSDGNSGNDFLFRLLRQFIPELYMGYEYNYLNFARNLSFKVNRDFYYYSPKNFESHSIFADWSLSSEDTFELNIGGKLGFVPVDSFVIREINSSIMYRPVNFLRLNMQVTAGGTYRDQSAYNFFSTTISAYLMF